MTIRVRSAVGPLLTEPRIGSEQISQRLAGHSLTILESRGDWHRVRGADEYGGWVHAGYLDMDAPSGDWKLSVGCTVVGRAGVLQPIPLGALVSADAQLVDGGALNPAEQAETFPTSPEAVARTARSAFAGARFEWGGVSPWGADCSGFVQTVFALHGVALPRDAWQQALIGEPCAGERPGDLLFFSEREDKRPTHVGIVVSANPLTMAHVALGRGGFAIDRLDSDEAYVEELRSKRVDARRPVRAAG